MFRADCIVLEPTQYVILCTCIAYIHTIHGQETTFMYCVHNLLEETLELCTEVQDSLNLM